MWISREIWLKALPLNKRLSACDTIKPALLSGFETVESFAFRLPSYRDALDNESPIHWIEARLLYLLEDPVLLLRWAIVKVEEAPSERFFWCEGAYLRSDTGSLQYSAHI